MEDRQKEASIEAASSLGAESNHESQYGDSGHSETPSDNSGHVKVAVVADLVGISYDFGPSNITKSSIRSMESYAQYFPKGYGQPLALNPS
jgi:hypothetical protein